MKYFIYVMLILALGMLIFNLFHVNYDNIFGQNSLGAVIGILASLCVIVMMLILMTSRKIRDKSNDQ